jgi:hypothetical protein
MEKKPNCERCRYAASDHIDGNIVCMYVGSSECSFEEKEEAPLDTVGGSENGN